MSKGPNLFGLQFGYEFGVMESSKRLIPLMEVIQHDVWTMPSQEKMGVHFERCHFGVLLQVNGYYLSHKAKTQPYFLLNPGWLIGIRDSYNGLS